MDIWYIIDRDVPGRHAMIADQFAHLSRYTSRVGMFRKAPYACGRRKVFIPEQTREVFRYLFIYIPSENVLAVTRLVLPSTLFS